MTDIQQGQKPVQKNKPSEEMRVQSGTCNSPSGNNSTGARKVLETITYPCPNCKRVFEREDDFSLHHGVRHAKLGPIPKVTPIVKIISKPPVETNQTERIPQSAHKKQRRSRINYKIDEQSFDDTSTSSDSSDTEERDSDRKSSSTYKVDNNDLVRQSHKKYRRKSEEHGKSNNNDTSSLSDNGTDISETVKVIPKKSKVGKKRKHHKSSDLDSDISDSDSSSGDEDIKSLMLLVLSSSKTRRLLGKLLRLVEEREKNRKLKRLQQQLTRKKCKCKTSNCNNDCRLCRKRFERSFFKKYLKDQSRSDVESEETSSDSDSSSSDSETREDRKKNSFKRMRMSKPKGRDDDSESGKRKSHPRSEGEIDNTDYPGNRR